jgi:uncharacterized protein (TIGR01244 family)
MTFNTLSDQVSVAPQITPEDVTRAREQGVRRVVNNRTDGEDPGQPDSAEVERWVRQAGMDYAWLPIMGRPSPRDAQAMGALLDDGAATLIYCRSGLRSAAAWAMAEVLAGRSEPEAARAAAARAGFDLSGLPL